MKWTADQLRAYEQRRASSHSGSPAIVESNPSHAPLAAKEVQGQAGDRILVRVTSYRKRLLDEDNLCEKYHVDLCRYAGLIPCDEASKVRIETRQEKSKVERVEIEILQTNAREGVLRV